MAFRIQVRRDTSANWQINNPVLLTGEMGYETNTGSLKIGDGQTDWNQLGYFAPAGETQIQVQYQGTAVGGGQYRILNFIGQGATLAAGATNTVNITVTGGTGSAGPAGPTGSVPILDSTSIVIAAPTGISFTGDGVNVTQSGSVAVINITGASASTSWNNTSRYRAYSSGSAQIWLVSSATVYSGLSWTRAGNTITVTRESHGHLEGEAVIIRNVNVDNEYCLIMGVTQDTFSFDVSSSSGTSSGSDSAYSLGFTTSSVDASGSTLVAPTNGDLQLLSAYIASGNRAGTTYALTLPTSSTNGAGANTSVNNMFFPIIRAQSLTTGTVANATFTMSTSSPYNVMTIGGLPSTDPVGIRFDF
jgi:hypothetical protein